MKSIDIKSLLIGVLGAALVLMLMGISHPLSPAGTDSIACETVSTIPSDIQCVS